MLENLYTTKMSSSKKTLQKRFTKIRSKSGRLAKIMSVVMTFVLIAALGTATVVMAAVGSDGLEHWDKEELYFTDGMRFTINITGLNVPEYIKTDVAGTDGIINCEFKRYDLRMKSGFTDDTGILTLSGENGKITMPYLDGYSPVNEEEYTNDLLKSTGADYLTGYVFCTADPKSSYNGWGYFDYTMTEDKHWINIYFAIADNSVKDVIFSFDGEYVLDENYSRINIGENMDRPKVYNLEFFGGMKDTVLSFGKMVRGARIFNSYEQKYYANIPSESFNIKLLSADERTIAINNKIQYSDRMIDFVIANIYDENNNLVFYNNIFNPSLNGIMNIECKNEKSLKKGKTYRVELAYCYDSGFNMVYRWQDYVTIQ